MAQIPLSATIAFPAARAGDAAHLTAFWPEHRLAAAPEAALLALPQGVAPPPRLRGAVLRYAAGLLRSPSFAGRHRALALLPLQDLPPILADAPLAPPPPADPAALARAAAAAALAAEARIGGEPGLPDPGAARLRLPPHGAVLVLDPCRPGRRRRRARRWPPPAPPPEAGRCCWRATRPPRPGRRRCCPASPGYASCARASRPGRCWTSPRTCMARRRRWRCWPPPPGCASPAGRWTRRRAGRR
ncbi:hypothetical protein [Pseudoroseomonas cervicalis]|uniref:hypothetical protein n=1 Tax=Teichococcus cervicalis TaxID=204525 RepID=UPI0022F18278|nr:hypothetical protein [Pseudoroseomonas cervicalis]WBV42953.1 hypothetical protein PFY06_17235 [Pseudoroseomonas cervicalis]